MSNSEYSLSIRLALVDDVPQLYRWDEKPHVQKAVSNSGTIGFDANWEEELGVRDDGTEFFIAEVNSEPIGAMQVINPATEQSHYWGAVAPNLRAIDIWIGEEEFIGRGFGSRMMTFAIEHCFADPSVSAILIDPLSNNTEAHRFYERLGFEFMERRQFDDESDCFVFRLTRDVWKARSSD
ncbi:MAG: acetyltransferase [Gammaproteobacteria bacterium]|nr:acetyltransferase [Gammaproteobacteria bacterium]